MEFRTATKKDFNRIFSGYRDVIENAEKRYFDEKFHRKMLTSSIKEGRNIVCEIDGKLVGFIEYETKTPNLPLIRDGAYWVEWVWTDPKYRKKGIGRALYEYLFKMLRKKGISRIAAEVMSSNAKSQLFHKKIGFEDKMVIYVKDI